MNFCGNGPLKYLRSRASTVARLLVFALCLQIALPLAGPAAAHSAETAFQADLIASLCHQDGNDASAPAQSTADGKHCVFCLPAVGPAAWTTSPPTIPAPLGGEALSLIPADHQAPDSSRPVSTRSRAPPSPPRHA